METVKKPSLCIECNKRPARHWRSSFCEECFRDILKDELKKETSKDER